MKNVTKGLFKRMRMNEVYSSSPILFAVLGFLLNILLLGSAAGSSPAYAETQVDWSPIMNKAAGYEPYFLDQGNEGYAIINGGSQIELSFYNSSFNTNSTVKVDWQPDGNIEILYAEESAQGFVILAESYSKTELSLNAYVIKLDSKGQLISSPEQILNAANIKKKDATCLVKASTDSTYWLISPNPTGKYTSIPTVVLNSDFEVDKSPSLDLKNSGFANYRQLSIDNYGSIYAMSCLDKPKGKRNPGVPAQEFHLSIFKNDGSNATHLFELHPPYGNVEASTLSIIPRGDGKVECSGLYAGVGYPGQEVKGVFFSRMNMETGELEEENIMAIDQNFFRRYMPNLNYLSGIQLHKFEIKNFTVDANGGYILAAEYIPTRSINIPVMEIISKAEFEVKPEAIFVFRFDGSGIVSWSHWIDRRQEYINNYNYKSFSMAVGPNGVRLCYSYQGNSYNVANGELRMVTLTLDGNKYMQVIDPVDGNKVRLCPANCAQSGGKMFLYGEQSSSCRVAAIDIP